jgi:dimethylhistidine N-methyltransferase
VAYVPVDISRTHLQQTANTLSAAYPQIEILPVCADFTQPFELPTASQKPTHAAVYFPGSTIGNFHPDEVLRLLGQIAALCGSGGGLLIGIDLKKDVDTLEAAYNDRQGVTAEFNLNLLERINRELAADFQLDQFRHDATYNEDQGRIEMYLVSEREQSVSIGDETFEFDKGDKICTEYSHKYTIAEFADIAAEVGLTLRRHWTDRQELFAVLHFAKLN